MSEVQPVSLIGVAEPLVAAVDNGGTQTRLVLREGDEVVSRTVYATPHDYETAIEKLNHDAKVLAGARVINAVGFALAGKIDPPGDRIVSAGELQAFGWVARPFRADVAEQFGLETAAVVLMNDCVAAAKSQQVVNRKVRDVESGYVETISTGFGGAGFDGDKLIPDEPGHEFFRSGAVCGCGKDGCAEAHISGSGILRNFGIRAEYLPDELWAGVVQDTVDVHLQLLRRLEAIGFTPQALYFFGSVAVKSQYILPGIIEGLNANRDKLSFVPAIWLAHHGEDSGLVGAGDAALEVVRS